MLIPDVSTYLIPVRHTPLSRHVALSASPFFLISNQTTSLPSMDKQLITLINKLQDVFATVGVSSDSINLPQITVGASCRGRGQAGSHASG